MSAATITADATLELRLKAMHLPAFLEHYLELAQRARPKAGVRPPLGRTKLVKRSRCGRTGDAGAHCLPAPAAPIRPRLTDPSNDC
jgi:hypothetical protein